MLLVVYFDTFRKELVKRLKENGIEFDIVKYDDLEKYISTHPPIKKVIIAGSKNRILRDNDFPLLKQFMKKNIKIIGICFGFQFLVHNTGGKIVEHTLFKGHRRLETGENLYFNHYDRVIDLPKKWKVISKVDEFINIAMTDKWVGFQFHPEMDAEYFNYYVLPFIQMNA